MADKQTVEEWKCWDCGSRGKMGTHCLDCGYEQGYKPPELNQLLIKERLGWLEALEVLYENNGKKLFGDFGDNLKELIKEAQSQLKAHLENQLGEKS